MHLSRRLLAAASAAIAIALCSPLAAARDTSPMTPPAHALQADTWPQPDFFSEAVGRSTLKPAARFRALGLTSTPAPPSARVMPVQMQAHGWTPQFAALVGAGLDRALADRGVSANRQTDLFDLDGPFARRFTDSETQAFAARAPGTPLLALFIGRDADKHVFVTLAKEYIDEHGGDGTRADLCGQEANGTVWSIAKMNMLLHGISTADLRNDDTLAEPQHVEGGELMRFDRVLSNPPFSINWGTADTDRQGQPVFQPKHRERFRYGQVPLGSKKADLMFLQHMVAVLRDGGMLATVMPHGVLFRGGEERAIRAAMIQADLLEA